jgi:hypothetical protein
MKTPIFVSMNGLISSLILILVLIYQLVIFKKLLSKTDSLSKLLSGSLTNLNNLISENISLRNQIEQLKKSKQSLFAVNVGDKVIINKDLHNKTASVDFEVIFECNVIEVTRNKLKLNAYDLKSNHDWPNNNRQSVIDYFQNKWENRSECDIIMEEYHIRDNKLNDLLNGLED